MDYTGIIQIIVICVLANHMGLVDAIEDVTKHKLWIINCCKCFTFWSSLVYLGFTRHNLLTSVAMAFCAAFISVWFELFLGVLNKVYEIIYTKIESDNTGNTENRECLQNELS